MASDVFNEGSSVGSGDQPRIAGVDAAMVKRLQESFWSFSDRGDQLADRFYARLFAENPDVRKMFPSDMAAQKRKLIDTLRTIVEYLHTPDVVLPMIRQLGIAHIDYNVREEHYPMVMHALITAMSELGGRNWTPELHNEWVIAIWQVAKLMMDAEKGGSLTP